MRKFLTALGVAAFLSVSALGTAFAAVVPQATVVENTVAGGMDAAGEVSGTITVNGGTTLSIFWGGTYSAANRFELQEEVGSPGSGAFQRVLRLDTNTANSDDATTFLTGPNRNAYRVFMTVAGTGDVLVKMTDANIVPNDFNATDHRVYMEYFTDFDTQTTAVDAAHFLAQIEGSTICNRIFHDLGNYTTRHSGAQEFELRAVEAVLLRLGPVHRYPLALAVIDDPQSELRILGVEDDDFLELRKGAVEGDEQDHR